MGVRHCEAPQEVGRPVILVKQQQVDVRSHICVSRQAHHKLDRLVPPGEEGGLEWVRLRDRAVRGELGERLFGSS